MNTVSSPVAGRTHLGIWPTPLQTMDGGAGIYAKREDLCGFAFGGSKVRALEPLLDDALARQARSIVVGGRRDSNWVALAAVAAARVGLGCHCVFDPGPSRPIAIALARHFGATLHTAQVPGADAVNTAIAGVARGLGPSAYAIPRAGASPAGVVAYRTMARELLAQLPVTRVDVVVALGSGGACAGLLLGFDEAYRSGAGTDVRVVGVPVGKSPMEATGAVRRLLEQVRQRQLSEAEPETAISRLRVLARSSSRSALADRLEARCGTLLDPVFAGPAWHTFCAQWPGAGRSTVLVASGGLPAYVDAVNGDG
jgi:D-cysteine desulfhydrase